MFAFKAILDARSNRKKFNSQRKKKNILRKEVERNMNRNLNCADNPIEIEDDEDCAVEVFIQKEKFDGDLKNPIEIHSSKSLKIKKDPQELADDVISSVDVLSNGNKINEEVNNAIEIHSTNSLKLKKDRIDDEPCKGKKINEGSNSFSSDSDYEDASIRSFKKFVVKSDKKEKKKMVKLEEKLVWSRNEIKTIFNGPCEFLTLLYVDRIQCNQMPFVRRFPVINFWTSDQLKFREIKELESGGFGNGVVANYNEDFESRSILDFVSNIQWVVYDLNKKVEMTLQKHGSHKKFQLMTPSNIRVRKLEKGF
ncbi:unnamed protein product [Lactuca virosa]|uniref:Uncharacterized protein n=1 Tax=Lactuca virosa TaxID=75947 RepID=A0AAU9NQR0_9ASTR|nr:unnamed protein product [Lactuca virosa]